MKVSLIPIGNSKGIKLGKALLKKYDINDAVELILEKGCLIIKPISSPRKDWDKAFKKMHENGDDRLLLPDIFEDINH